MNETILYAVWCALLLENWGKWSSHKILYVSYFLNIDSSYVHPLSHFLDIIFVEIFVLSCMNDDEKNLKFHQWSSHGVSYPFTFDLTTKTTEQIELKKNFFFIRRQTIYQTFIYKCLRFQDYKNNIPHRYNISWKV